MVELGFVDSGVVERVGGRVSVFVNCCKDESESVNKLDFCDRDFFTTLLNGKLITLPLEFVKSLHNSVPKKDSVKMYEFIEHGIGRWYKNPFRSFNIPKGEAQKIAWEVIEKWEVIDDIEK